MRDSFFDFDCPYCGEPQTFEIDPVDAASGRFVVDCSVCCRPAHALLRKSGSSVSLEISTEDRD